MAAFSHQQYPFIHDSVFQSNNPINNNNTVSFIQFCQSDENPLIATSDNKNTESSSMVEKFQNSSENISQKRKSRENSAQSKDTRTGQSKKQRKCNANKKEKKKVDDNGEEEEEEEAPLGYIHVRARRGQATDSHSLAERARREKISERMKLLQALVPGCDKVTGKALMLDEIINYVQSLQNLVEFLSMKLASFNPMIYDFGVNPYVPLMTRQCSPNETTTYADSITAAIAATFTTPQLTNQSSYLDHPFLLPQVQMLNLLTKDSDGSVLWDLEGPKQKFMNPSSLIINDDNLCSFL